MSEWNKSESIAALVADLCQAQMQFDPVLKDSDNPAYHSKYADLSSVISATQKALTKQGLVVIQLPQASLGNGDKLLTLTTVLAHKSGQWISSDLTLPAMMRERFDAQSVGSAITYARRYAYQAIIGVAAEVDDDGNAAVGQGSKAAAQAVADRKLAEHAAKTPTAPKVTEKLSVAHMPGDESQLSGTGLASLLSALDANEPHFKKTFMRFDEESCFWFVKTAKAFVLQDICTSIGIEAAMVEPGSEGPIKAVIPPMAQPPADGYFPITAMTTKTVKADKDGNVIKVSLTWDGKTREVATWFHGLFGLLTDCYMKKTPVRLVIVDKGQYSNVVGVHGAEKADDGIWRFPVQRELI